MTVVLTQKLLRQIEVHGESTYPNEGAGFMLGHANSDVTITMLLPLENKREQEAQYNRYELSPRDFMRAELEADRHSLSVVGVFHSHPDHPAQPSEFDREHALPNFSYFITAVAGGKAKQTRAWRLREDRRAFDEDDIKLTVPDSE